MRTDLDVDMTKANDKCKFDVERKNLSSLLEYMPASGYDYYEFSVLWKKITNRYISISFFFIAIPAYLLPLTIPDILDSFYPLWKQNFPFLLDRYNFAKDYSNYSANQFMVCSVGSIIITLYLCFYYIYLYIKFYIKNKISRRLGLKAIFGGTLIALMSYLATDFLFFYYTNTLDREYLGTFYLILGPIYPFLCTLYASCFPALLVQPLLLIIKGIAQVR